MKLSIKKHDIQLHLISEVLLTPIPLGLIGAKPVLWFGGVKQQAFAWTNYGQKL